MKISLKWLQEYFENKLPLPEMLEEAFMFHSFEVESRDGDLLDLNVLPDRAGYALCHRGIAKELSATIGIPMKADPLREEISQWDKSKLLSVKIENMDKCRRYIGAVIHGVKVGPSPEWLRESLLSVGQRSVNNVVDATNYVMLNIGQPLHAFDADKIGGENGIRKITVRDAYENEEITTLSGEKIELTEDTLVIADAVKDSSLAIAGIKGGIAAEVSDKTTKLIIEAANFNGAAVRKAAQNLKIITDSSLRFQNNPSSDLAIYGMRDVLKLITDIAGGVVEGIIDIYPEPACAVSVSVSLNKINGTLGTSFSPDEVSDVFVKLGFGVVEADGVFTVVPPFERTDIAIPEDLVEEVGRIKGYDAVLPMELPALSNSPDLARFNGIERIKDFFADQGFIEISTQSFAKDGDIILENPLDKTRPVLRVSLIGNVKNAFNRALQYAPLLPNMADEPKLFEIGNVFTKDGERLMLAYVGEVNGGGELGDIFKNKEEREGVVELPLYDDALVHLGENYTPLSFEQGTYKPFSVYPFVTRDIAVWVPEDLDRKKIESVIIDNGGKFLAREPVLFDRFVKDGRVSYAFRLVFQSLDRTLTDDEINEIMDNISSVMNKKSGWAVR